MKYLAGIDEAGRGPLAGPVAVAALALSQKAQHRVLSFFPKGKVRDSKKLTPGVREEIFRLLRKAKVSGRISYAVVFGSAAAIDRLGIAIVINKLVGQVLEELGAEAKECLVLLDGALRAPSRFSHQKTIIKGDEKEAVIALASIVAKVSRDRLMVRLSKKFPDYGFEVHKGYGTRAHYEKIKKHGLSPIHRRSFLKNLLK